MPLNLRRTSSLPAIRARAGSGTGRLWSKVHRLRSIGSSCQLLAFKQFVTPPREEPVCLFVTYKLQSAYVMEVRYYITKTGKDVVDEWIAGLADDRAEARIFARIERLSSRNFGDHKSLGGGLFELRIDVDPGYRVYCAMMGRTCVLLLCGGINASSRPTFGANVRTSTVT